MQKKISTSMKTLITKLFRVYFIDIHPLSENAFLPKANLLLFALIN